MRPWGDRHSQVPGSGCRTCQRPWVFTIVMAPYVGSEVADSGLARWPAAVRAQIRDGVVDVGAAAHSGGVGKHISGVAQQDLFAQLRRDFVAVDRDVSGG